MENDYIFIFSKVKAYIITINMNLQLMEIHVKQSKKEQNGAET